MNAGASNGPAATVELVPQGVAVDASGNVYEVQAVYNIIKVITPGTPGSGGRRHGLDLRGHCLPRRRGRPGGIRVLYAAHGGGRGCLRPRLCRGLPQ